MKNIVVIMLVFVCSLTSFSQDTINKNQPGNASEMFKQINAAGTNLNKGGALGYSAVLLELAGTVIMLLPDQEGINSPQETMYFGAAMVISGIVIHVISYAKFIKAGKILEGMKPADCGIGIKIPLN